MDCLKYAKFNKNDFPYMYCFDTIAIYSTNTCECIRVCVCDSPQKTAKCDIIFSSISFATDILIWCRK